MSRKKTMPMHDAEIIALLEKPTKDVWRFVYKIRDEAEVAQVVAALRNSKKSSTRRLLCSILMLQAEMEVPDIKLATPALIEAVRDPDEEIRWEAANALEAIADLAAGPALLEQYSREEDAAVREAIASSMGASQYAPAVPALIEALSSPNEMLRYAATWGLRHLRPQEAKEPLRRAVAVETNALAIPVMRETLEEIEGPPELFTPEAKMERLIAQLRNAETELRVKAATALGGMLDERVLAPLLTLLEDKQSEIRYYALLAFTGLAESRASKRFVQVHRERVQGPLIQALYDSDSHVRAQAATALDAWGDERVVEPLLAALRDEDLDVRISVVEALSNQKDERVIEPLLTVFLTEEDMRIRGFAAQGLGRWQDARAVNVLIHGLQDERAEVRSDAAELLCWLADERAVPALLVTLQDSNQEVREWSIEALWSLCIAKGDDLTVETSERMREPLLHALQDENAEVRERASDVLEWLA